MLGEEEALDKCTIVAFGNGTKVVEKSKMQPDGTVINDCCGKLTFKLGYSFNNFHIFSFHTRELAQFIN